MGTGVDPTGDKDCPTPHLPSCPHVNTHEVPYSHLSVFPSASVRPQKRSATPWFQALHSARGPQPPQRREGSGRFVPDSKLKSLFRSTVDPALETGLRVGSAGAAHPSRRAGRDLNSPPCRQPLALRYGQDGIQSPGDPNRAEMQSSTPTSTAFTVRSPGKARVPRNKEGKARHTTPCHATPHQPSQEAQGEIFFPFPQSGHLSYIHHLVTPAVKPQLSRAEPKGEDRTSGLRCECPPNTMR